jgi:serine/threonine protein kinase
MEIAIKWISKKALRHEMHLLKEEFEISKAIRHPNVVEFFEIFEDSENFYISMEYWNGGTLK